MQNLMPPIDTTDHAFHDGDPTTGQLGTIVTAAWLNDVQGATRDIQAEIIAVLTKAGIQPNPQKQNQLAEAISQIIGSGGYATSGDLTLGLSKKIDKADIAQQLGNDTTKVPSLHLVATELGKKASIADANSKLAKDKNGADIPDKDAFIENLGLPEKYQPIGTYADGKVFKALAGDGASITELSGKYLLALKEDGTVGLYSKESGGFLWAVVRGALAQITGQDAGLIMSQKAITDALNLLTPLSSFTSGAGWIRFPDGTIIQQGVSIAGQLTYPTTIQFPIPFTSVPTVIACFDSASNKATDCPSFATSQGWNPLANFFLMSSRTSGGESAGANWIAIAKGK
ncbi:hypothetical protein CKG00_12525 [Morganella morganii]|uniref:Putative tail fiber protein gp53-like C-terminal domain-containing protein n=1 Tax=Morganella morganii TaxID=582 RepID=A0A433ZYB3_MORMO|nr:hypothetical protein [Morganella morganii]RUT67102.1 hypothetical protein CKG00_12525 [Morganella morganii]